MNKLILSFTAAVLFSAVAHAKKQEPECVPFSQGLELSDNQYAPMYNAPAFVDVQGTNFDIWASFTYWNVSEQGMDVAFIAPVSATTPEAVVPGSVVAIENDWTPGFKLGAAFNTNYDGWVGSAEYTWIRFSTSVSKSNTTGNSAFDFTASQLFPNITTSGVTKIQSDWNMHLDQIDAVFSRPYYQGTRLTAMPFAGLRSLFIRQRQTGNATTSAGLNLVVLKSQCWSLGAVAGTSGHWLVGKGFRFEGSMAGSLLYTQYTTLSFNYTQAANFSAQTKQTNLNAVRPTLEFGLGLGWGSYLYDQKYFIDFSANYDFNYYWSQNMMHILPSMNSEYETNFQGALMLHGLVLTGRFDF